MCGAGRGGGGAGWGSWVGDLGDERGMDMALAVSACDAVSVVDFEMAHGWSTGVAGVAGYCIYAGNT